MRIIAGSARGRRLLTPRDRKTRPPLGRIRESVFSILNDRVEAARVLDLFAGVGGFGLEALSRGARHVRFVEASRDAAAFLQRNLSLLGFEGRATIEVADALTVPVATELDGEADFDVVFMDPPFEMFKDATMETRLLGRVRELLSMLRHDSGVLVVRQPSFFRRELVPAPASARSYGESRVLFFAPGRNEKSPERVR